MSLEHAISVVGNLSLLAKRLGKAQSTVWYWKQIGKVPPEHCAAVEVATGGVVSRYALRPDVFGQETAHAVRRKRKALFGKAGQ